MSKIKYCPECGRKFEDNDVFCSTCGYKVNNDTTSQKSSNTNDSKSRIGAGLLGLFLGYLGIHNFYLGYTSKAVAQILLTTIGWIFCGVGPAVAAIWGFIEGIMILAGSIKEDANGVELRD
ncbi:MAG: TM2 domain-containing protein [Bacilli bacterium]|nr:TM2 domain-containing protein [Bacilli bacterium]